MLVILTFFFNYLTLFSQDRLRSCGSDVLHFKQLKENLSYKEKFESSNEKWQKYAIEQPAKILKNRSAALTNPVELAVVFNNMTTAMTDIQYENVITNLNGIFTGTQISFCRTKKYANGDNYPLLSYNHSTTITSFLSSDDIAINTIVQNSLSQNPIRFPSLNYINIYIVDDILGSTAGFAYMPSAHGSNNDGIFIERLWLLNTDPNDIKILAHEMGHYLGLFHVFGICDPSTIALLDNAGTNPCSCDNDNCLFNGDMVCDTPPSMLNPTILSPLNNSCNTDALATIHDSLMPLNDIPDDKSNYMDYGPQVSHNHFTSGQILRMQFMIDQISGPRKSLLGVAACTDCSLMNGCSFNINPSISFPVTDTRHTIKQTIAGTPPIIFTANNSGCPSATTPTGMTYSWSLVLLDQTAGAVVAPTTLGTTFTLPSNIIDGNYQLTLIASINANCKETSTYNFVIEPVAGLCNFTLPLNNSNWTGWDRISFQNGWQLNYGTVPLSYANGSLPNLPGQPNFDPSGFDIVPIIAGQLTNGDVNFTGMTLPSTTNIDKVIRVGRIMTSSDLSSGNAYYAKVKINVNKNNCKYRVWYLGATEGITSQFNFQNVNNYSDSGFGILNLYNYNSPANATTTNYNSIIGNDEKGDYYRYFKNDLYSKGYNTASSDYTNTLPYKTNSWKFYDLDYSEFINLSQDTEITLTFFAHSNSSASALQKAYAYFGVECLGGGTPSDFDFNVTDKSLPCMSPGVSNTISIDLNYPDYAPYNLSDYANNITNFVNIQIFRESGVSGVYNTSPEPGINLFFRKYILTLNASDAPFVNFRMVYKTLHKTITRDFRVFIGFYNHILPVCIDGGQIDNTQYDPVLINGDILLCGTDILPILKLTDTCIPASLNPTYKWFSNGNEITGATNNNLQLTNFNYTKDYCYDYQRRTYFKEPYCGNDDFIVSQEFHVYNKETLLLNPQNVSGNNICYDGRYNLDFKFGFNNYSKCILPTHFIQNPLQVNTYLFELFDQNTGIVIGNSFNFTSNTLINNYLDFGNLNFEFDNIVGGLALFTPTPTNNIFKVGLRITCNYLGCNFIKNIDNLYGFTINNSAIGSQIGFSCLTNIVSSINDGMTTGGYVWQFSHDSTFATGVSTIAGQSGATITPLNISLLGSLPVYIRRKSLGNGICSAESYSNIITINQNPAPITMPTNFIQCVGLSSPLPLVSTNGIVGTWSPIFDPNATKTYTFTPSAGQCTSIATVQAIVNITSGIIAQFNNPIISICQNQLPYNLPIKDSLNHDGTWTLTGSGTIITQAIQTGVYIFTPIGNCGVPATLTLNVNTSPATTFNLLPNYCKGSVVTLPQNSSNAVIVNGIWHLNSATGANVTSINTSTIGTFTYVFVANSSNRCNDFVYNVTITPNNIIPTFNFPLSICSGGIVPVLPLISTNSISITGTWSPTIINNNFSGDYLFRPNAGQCAQNIIIHIDVIPCSITINWGTDVSCQLFGLEPGSETFSQGIVDGPCIRVCENSTVTYELAGNTSSIASTDWNILGGTVVSSSSTQCIVNWNSVNYCLLQGLIHFIDGTTMTIDKCIEKLKSPIANFGINPDLNATSIDVCLNSVVNFTNLSTSNDGNQTLYYSWNFGDGSPESTVINPSHTYNGVGDFEVTLTVSNGCSCSSTYSVIVHVGLESVQIDCPSVVCENSITNYSLPASYVDCHDIIWSTTDGTISPTHSSTNQVSVTWDHVNSSGFAYLSVASNECIRCIAPIKIPIIKTIGTIVGETTICAKIQNTYKLPQWPSTVFNWTLAANGTGAILLHNYQTNEVIIKANDIGTITLYCNYYNTLLSCGGTAQITIKVKPSLKLTGNLNPCKNTTNTYQILDQNNNNVLGLNWEINGPNGITISGSGSPFSTTFTETGNYLFNIVGSATSTCYTYNLIKVVTALPKPLVLNGDLIVCPSIPFTYSVPHLPNAVTHWEVIGGIVNGNILTGDSIEVLFNPSLITYSIKAWYESLNCSSDKLTTTISRDTPVMVITDGNGNLNNTTECGSSLQTYSVNDINADSYKWEIVPVTAGSVQTGQNTTSVTVLWNQNVSLFATLRLTVRKCGAGYIKNFRVTIVNTVSINLTSPATICAGTPISPSFSLSLGTIFNNVTWDFGDGTPTVTSTSNIAPPHIYNSLLTASTTYNITATVTNPNGCILPAIKTVAITVSPTPIFDLTPNYEGQYVYVCDALLSNPAYISSINLQSGFGYTNTIQWYNGTIPVSVAAGGNSPIFNFATAYSAHGIGDYYAVVTNNFGCSRTTQAIYVRYNCGGGPITGTGIAPSPCLTPCPLDFSVTETCQGFEAHPTLLGCATSNLRWSFADSGWASSVQVITNNSTTFEATNFEPGVYFIDFLANYSGCGLNLTKQIRKRFIVPYKAGLKYNATCSGNGYNVTLIDQSVYYPITPIQNFSFSYDNGANWYPGSVLGGMHQLQLNNMAPGTYQIGIKISSTGHTECTKFLTLDLPALPVATFTFTNNACQGTAMQFHADDQTPGLQYDWTFVDGSHNLQPNPVKVSNFTDPQLVLLTVTNKLGCSATFQTDVIFRKVDLYGGLTLVPQTVCQGANQLIKFNQTSSTTALQATNFVWYKNVNTLYPFTSAIFATTTVPQLSVTQSGNYFVYVTDANGCSYNYNPSITVKPIRLPDAPVIFGNPTQCIGSSINMSVPANNNLIYNWTINGVAQPLLYNQSAISYNPPNLGVYVFGCTAQTLATQGSCTSAVANFTTTVMAQPNTPILSFSKTSCDPYLFDVEVTNPQAGIEYYWSNGAIGTSTQSTHGGPIEVRAQSLNCSKTTQIKLPEDLSTFEWYFPKGCYSFCKESFNGFVTNPIYPVQNWTWFDNGSPLTSGSGIIGDFNQFDPEHSYQLYLRDGYCDKTFREFSFDFESCPSCELVINKLDVRPVYLGAACAFMVDIEITNPFGLDVNFMLSAPNGEGYFVISNFVLLTGQHTYQFIFYPTNGFIQGNVMCNLQGNIRGSDCLTQLNINFSPTCRRSKNNLGNNIDYVSDMLIIAPNPTSKSTNLIYNFSNNLGKKTIELYDLLGRLLQSFNLETQSGSQDLDCSNLASGTYNIVMKENEVVLKTNKLIKVE